MTAPRWSRIVGIGAAIDNMSAGVGAGAALGVALALLIGGRNEVIDATENR